MKATAKNTGKMLSGAGGAGGNMLGQPNATDMVNHPPHYQTHDEPGVPDVECIDAIHAQLGREGFIAFLRGQVARYNWRVGRKDARPHEAKKAQWYMNKLVEVLGDDAT